MIWPIAFLLTQITEIAVAMLIWKEDRKKVFCIVFLASTITHPIIWFVFPRLSQQYDWSYPTYLMVAESYAYLVEILWYTVMRTPRPVLLSCAANTASFLLGLVLHSFMSGH